MKTSAQCIFHNFIYLAIGVGLLLSLGQCQPVPKPFASEHKGNFSAILIGPRAGIVVSPIAGRIPGDVARKLADAMARALRGREITASTTHGHSRSHRLLGTATLIAYDQLRLAWRLTTTDNTETLAVTLTEEIAPKAWQEADHALLQRLAENGADAVDRNLRQQERGRGRRIALAPVTLGPLDGIPGGGAELAMAMRDALMDAGVPVSDNPTDDGFILLGSMRVSPDGTGQRIEMIWHLIRPDGREFGTIRQANTVPFEQLAGNRQNLARTIARAGAPGVQNLLRRDPG